MSNPPEPACDTGAPMRLRAIGAISTPFRTRAECPRNGRALTPAPLCRVRVDPAFRPGLLGIAGFSHLILIYWLHEAAGEDALVFQPPFYSAQRGIFATRAPHRPNPVGLSVVEFAGEDPDGALCVRNLDCIDGTVLLDIKPYLPTTDSEPLASMGWLAGCATARTG